MSKLVESIKTNKKLQSNLITFGLVIVMYAVCQILAVSGVLSNSMKGLLIQFCYYIIMAVSLNLTVGILGELSLGHAGFMCIGAYTYGIFAKVTSAGNLPRFAVILISLVMAAIIAAIFGFLIGIPVLRLKGDYLAIVTLAFGEIIKNVTGSLYIAKDSHGLHFSLNGTSDMGLEAENLVIIDGPKGITGLTSGVSFTLGAVLVILTLIIVLNLINSRTGRAVMAIRDNRIAAEATGINVTKYKMLAFTISASLAGLAGVLYAGSLSTLTSTSKNFGYNMSIMILVYVVLGGIGSIRGSVIATVILVLLPEKLRFVNSYRMLIYAIVLIAMMILNWSPAARVWREKVTANIKAKFFKKKPGQEVKEEK